MSRAATKPNYKDDSSDEETFSDSDVKVKTPKKNDSVKKSDPKKPVVKKEIEKKSSSKRPRDESGEENGEDSDDSDDDEDNDSSGSASESGSGSGSNESDDNNDDEDEDDDDDDEEDSDGDQKKKSSAKRKDAPAKKKAPPAKKAKVNEKKKAKKSKKAKKQDKKKTEVKKESASDEKERKTKKQTKLDRLEEARKAYKWWEAEELPGGIHWRKLEHAGIMFTPPYEPHHVPLLYNAERVSMNAEQEEVASFYAAMPEDGPQLGNPKVRKVFQSNFFADFKNTLESGSVIKEFSRCDFSLIRTHLDTQKALKKAATDVEKKEKKVMKDRDTLKFAYALIDGRMEKVGKLNMEPPGLFRGRGEHPKTGEVKVRCFSESVSINCAEDAAPPMNGLPGHAWKDIRHDNSVTWLCDWQENINNQHKYVMLSADSSFKGKSDTEKYSKAMKLKSCIHKIRKDYTKKMKSVDSLDKQIGTAMWLIDILALRVGGEKGEDEADTVGTCSLRVEHFTYAPDGIPELELSFLGKDSMLFKQMINFAKFGELGLTVFDNLRNFCKKKKSDEQVFKDLTPTILNEHLSSLMKGLSAKVFRTYNAIHLIS